MEWDIYTDKKEKLNTKIESKEVSYVAERVATHCTVPKQVPAVVLILSTSQKERWDKNLLPTKKRLIYF